MPAVPVFAPGGYRYVRAVFQYSGGVAAEPGYEIERARFLKPLPLAEAFAAVEAHLKAIGRPTTAFAQCELRSPEPFTDQGFFDFNKVYVGTLARWGIYKDGDPLMNPVARTNVGPEYDKPAGPSMFAFSYTVPAPNARRGTFVLAGGGDAREGGPSYRDRIVRLRDTSPEGLREKVSFVIAEMERRMKLLGFGWQDAVTTEIYTVQNVGHLVGELLAARGAAAGGVVWNYTRPPVVDLEYEMDVRGAAREIVL
ncbi:MAG: hypothetical protein IPK29_14415 [Betaproteobacteria bacterium]|nr:hypothetical protein [Betaproteobacteria bacterium]